MNLYVYMFEFCMSSVNSGGNYWKKGKHIYYFQVFNITGRRVYLLFFIMHGKDNGEEDA